jgi:hypothetical protein
MWFLNEVMLMGPWNIVFLAAVLLASFFAFLTGRRDLRYVAAALIVSLMGARVATIAGHEMLHGVFLTISALLCFWGGSQLAIAVALIYAVRIFFLVLGMIGAIGIGVMWAWTEVFLAIQILLVAGGAVNGYADRRRASACNRVSA